MSEGYQTHEDIPEIPEGVALPDSTGSLVPDAEEPEEVDYSEIETELIEEEMSKRGDTTE